MKTLKNFIDGLVLALLSFIVVILVIFLPFTGYNPAFKRSAQLSSYNNDTIVTEQYCSYNIDCSLSICLLLNNTDYIIYKQEKSLISSCSDKCGSGLYPMHLSLSGSCFLILVCIAIYLLLQYPTDKIVLICMLVIPILVSGLIIIFMLIDHYSYIMILIVMSVCTALISISFLRIKLQKNPEQYAINVKNVKNGKKWFYIIFWLSTIFILLSIVLITINQYDLPIENFKEERIEYITGIDNDGNIILTDSCTNARNCGEKLCLISNMGNVRKIKITQVWNNTRDCSYQTREYDLSLGVALFFIMILILTIISMLLCYILGYEPDNTTAPKLLIVLVFVYSLLILFIGLTYLFFKAKSIESCNIWVQILATTLLMIIPIAKLSAHILKHRLFCPNQ